MNTIPAMRLTFENECDEVIWGIFRNGDMEAFASLYHRHFRTLLQCGAMILPGNRDFVKDCIHDLFIEIWKNKMNLVTPDSVKAYLVRSLQRKIIRQLKSIRSKEKKIGIIPEIQVDYSVEEQIIADQFMDEQQNRVTKALDVLTKRQKEAVYLKFYGNLSYKEISTQMAISADSVYNLVSKAIDSLQQDLTKVSKR